MPYILTSITLAGAAIGGCLGYASANPYSVRHTEIPDVKIATQTPPGYEPLVDLERGSATRSVATQTSPKMTSLTDCSAGVGLWRAPSQREAKTMDPAASASLLIS